MADRADTRRSDAPATAIAALLGQFLDGRPLRTASLIVTVFGDAIVPRGGRLSIRALIDLMAGLGIEAGAVRTAMSRLVADGLFVRQGGGRRPVYALSASGERTFADAFRRVYAGERAQAGSGFRMIVLPGAGRRGFDPAGLTGAGYRAMAAGVYVAPGSAPQVDLPPGAFRLTAQADQATARRIAGELLGGGAAEAAYRRFCADFARPAAEALARAPAPADAFVLRTLAIHAFRRAVISDPGLPDDLIAADRPDLAARGLVTRIYAAVVPGSESHLEAVARAGGEPLPPPSIDLLHRFPQT